MPEKELRCVPSDVTLNCETSARTNVRVVVSDRKEGVTIKGIGYDSSRISLNPVSKVTNASGAAEFEIQCMGGAFCPSRTTVTFVDDGAEYEECDLDVDCESLEEDTAPYYAFITYPIQLPAPQVRSGLPFAPTRKSAARTRKNKT